MWSAVMPDRMETGKSVEVSWEGASIAELLPYHKIPHRTFEIYIWINVARKMLGST